MPPRPDLPGDEAAPLDANVESGWIASGVWRTWELPGDLVRGEDFHVKALEGLVGPSRGEIVEQPVAATLRREPTNVHDPNAIRVEVEGAFVGFIARELAAQLAPFLDSIQCQAFAVAGVIRRPSYAASAPQMYLWLSRRLTPGPEIDMPPGAAEEFVERRPPSGLQWVAARGAAVERYFELRDQIMGAWAARDFDFVAHASRATVEILDAVVAEVLQQEGRFWTSLPPAIAHGGPCMALLEDADSLEFMRGIVMANPHLRQWLPSVEESIADEVLTREVVAYVGQHPGVPQKDLARFMDRDPPGTRRVCWMLSHADRIEREKRGTSYVIRLASAR